MIQKIQLCELGVDLKQEDNKAGFLGVRLKRDTETGFIEIKKIRFIERAIEELGLEDVTTHEKYTPAEASQLVKDEDRELASVTFSYSSVVSMLLYLPGHICPNIAYAL